MRANLQRLGAVLMLACVMAPLPVALGIFTVGTLLFCGGFTDH